MGERIGEREVVLESVYAIVDDTKRY